MRKLFEGNTTFLGKLSQISKFALLQGVFFKMQQFAKLVWMTAMCFLNSRQMTYTTFAEKPSGGCTRKPLYPATSQMCLCCIKMIREEAFSSRQCFVISKSESWTLKRLSLKRCLFSFLVKMLIASLSSVFEARLHSCTPLQPFALLLDSVSRHASRNVVRSLIPGFFFSIKLRSGGKTNQVKWN